MVKIDLITGFLGSGKTTFIRKYAQYLMDAGNNIGILENDYGAVNVDMMLLQDLMGENCELEMISGGCDKDCHRRRFKTKLIAMGMCGYDRVIVEPSGIFDVDEFFDALRRWRSADFSRRLRRLECFRDKFPMPAQNGFRTNDGSQIVEPFADSLALFGKKPPLFVSETHAFFTCGQLGLDDLKLCVEEFVFPNELFVDIC